MSSRRAAQWSWALTAWANHSFVTTIMVGLFPIFFAKYWAASLPGTTSTFYLGVTNSTASLLVMLAAPWLGALADRRGRKKRWFGITTVLGALATALLAPIGEGQWVPALIVFGLASIAFWAGSSFQDALIMQVSDRHDSNRISALGFALGYLGGGLLFLINAELVLHPAWLHLPDAVAAMRLACFDVAAWWVIFTLPMFRHVQEAPAVDEPTGWRELWSTVRSVLRDRPVMNFLLAYWLYIDGISTVQLMAVDFGSKLGFSSSALLQALLLVQFVSWPFAWLFGRLGDRIGTKRAIYLGLAVFVAITVFAYFMHVEWQFYVLAVAFGTVQGGVQALSRSYFASLIPRERAGEYFGFYNMLAKFAAVLGPLVMGVVAITTGNQRLSILALVLFFVIGAWLLSRVPEPANAAGTAPGRPLSGSGAK